MFLYVSVTCDVEASDSSLWNSSKSKRKRKKTETNTEFDWKHLSQFENWIEYETIFLISVQPDVPGPEGQCVGSGPQLHVLLPAGLCSGRRLPMEVRERGVGGCRPGGGPQRGARPRRHLHPPWLAELRRSLDEGGGDVQQSQTHQQGERRRTGEDSSPASLPSLLFFFCPLSASPCQERLSLSPPRIVLEWARDYRL